MTLREYSAMDISSPVIAHHGIKGQKWGVRRYQKSDGSLTSAGRERYTTDQEADPSTLSRREKRRAANKYDYRESDRYKNANVLSRRKQDANYYRNKQFYGRKAANRIEYNVRVNRKRRGKEEGRAFRSKIIKSLAVAIGTRAVAIGVAKGLKAYAEFNVGQQILNNYGNVQAHPVHDKKGINLDFKKQQRIMELGRAYLDANGYNGVSGRDRVRKMAEAAHKARSTSRNVPSSVQRIGKAIIDM